VTDTNSGLIDLALRTATTVHAKHVDNAGKPYILHIHDVALRLENTNERLVAYLHDTLEDCTSETRHLVESTLREMPPIVQRAVRLITRTKSVPYHRYIEILSVDPTARHVKIADLQSNLSFERRGGLSDSLRERYENALEFLCSIEAEYLKGN
jgi:(p)ppGpp synthase/HD superfamily hydrolase